jgi:hypothetical protein
MGSAWSYLTRTIGYLDPIIGQRRGAFATQATMAACLHPQSMFRRGLLFDVDLVDLSATCAQRGHHLTNESTTGARAGATRRFWFLSKLPPRPSKGSRLRRRFGVDADNGCGSSASLEYDPTFDLLCVVTRTTCILCFQEVQCPGPLTLSFLTR